MSHAFHERATQPRSYVGVGFVVALHMAAIYALSAGLIKSPPKPPEIVTLKPLPPEVHEPPPPAPPIQVDRPVLREPVAIPVPTPADIDVIPDFKPQVTTEVSDSRQPISTGASRTEVPAMPAQAKNPPVTGPGAVCSVMPKPEVPTVNWAGEAVLQVIATVRGGRVVGTDFRVAQGALDSKTKRSLQRSVESALAGYQCQGDAVFQQEFAFRID